MAVTSATVALSLALALAAPPSRELAAPPARVFAAPEARASAAPEARASAAPAAPASAAPAAPASAAQPVRVLAAPPVRIEDTPGGYYSLDENREREPDDGDKKKLVGTILVPLGGLRLGLGAAMYVMASPRYCARIYGANVTERTCDGLQVYGLVGVGMGSLMFVTGAVFLAWGLTQQARHNKWMRERGMAVAPMLSRDVQGVSFGFRF